MSASIKLSHFLPPPNEVPTEQVLLTRERLVQYLKEWWPELDTRPNSVFGDLVLTPMATTVAALEIAYARRDSDLNLNNVARGIIFDPEFVDGFLNNFGALARSSVQSSGLLQLTLSADQTYVFDADTAFTFNGNTFKVRPEEGNPVILRGSADASPGRKLTRDNSQFYIVLLPVIGAQGVTVADGTVGGTSWTEPNLVSVTAVGDFDAGNVGDSLPERALRARYLFAAATLTSRAGAESFVRSMFPGLAAASVVVTSDVEMVRDGTNVLAVSEGALDLYVRSRRTYARNQTRQRLAYDQNKDAWVGALQTASVPAFFSSVGVFRADQPENVRSLLKVYARSTHADADGLGVAYSAYEQLGVEVRDQSPSDFTEARNSDVLLRAGTAGTMLLLAGQYGGSRFGRRTGRRVSMRYDGVLMVAVPNIAEAVAHASFTVRDLDTNETGTVWFAPSGASYGLMVPDAADARSLFNGLALQLYNGDNFLASNFGGTVFEFSFEARSADFIVDYQFDPALPVVDQLVNGNDHKPVGVSVMVKSFIICQVTRMDITYRSYPGGAFNDSQARNDIANYLNGLAYPDRYEPTIVGAILNRNGAAGLVSLQVQGRFYPSLAHVFVDKLGQEEVISHPLTDTLQPPSGAPNYGPRNISYLIDLNTITFTSSAG